MSEIKIRYGLQPLQVIQREWGECLKCVIGRYAGHHVFWEVFPPEAKQVDFVFIGEGPGIEEDQKGIPFIGPAGEVLRQALDYVHHNMLCPQCGGVPDDNCRICLGEGAISYAFINTVLCRPFKNPKFPKSTGNRPPTREEVMNCMPRLATTISAFNPEHIVFLGKEPYSYALTLSREYGIDPTRYAIAKLDHPSYILRQGGIKYSEPGEPPTKFQEYSLKLQAQFDFFWRRRTQAWENTHEYHVQREAAWKASKSQSVKIKIRRRK